MPRAGARSWQGGFTLLELILAMLIVCVVLALAAPSLRGFAQGRAVVNTADQLVSLARLAQQQAVSEARTYRLNIEPRDGLYYLSAQDGDQFLRIEADWGRAFELGEQISAETDCLRDSDGEYLEFYPDGRCTPGAILLTDRTGLRVRVESVSATEPFRVVEEVEP